MYFFQICIYIYIFLNSWKVEGLNCPFLMASFCEDHLIESGEHWKVSKFICVPAWKVMWWLEPQQSCCCMRNRQGQLLKWLPRYFWTVEPRSDFCCFIWATKLLFYYLQMKILQSLTTGHRHCWYRQQQCLTNVVPCIGGRDHCRKDCWCFWDRSRLLSHTCKDFLQPLLWTLPNTALFITAEKQNLLPSLRSLCSRVGLFTFLFVSVSMILRFLTSVLHRLFSVSAERCLEPLRKRTLFAGTYCLGSTF